MARHKKARQGGSPDPFRIGVLLLQLVRMVWDHLI